MSIQKSIEYINKVITLFEENPVDDLNDELIRGHLYNAIHELKINKELEWGNVEICECGEQSICKLPGFDVIPDRFFCKECFFKQPIKELK